MQPKEAWLARARTGVSLVTPTIGDPPRCESHRALPARANTPERLERRQPLIQIESPLVQRVTVRSLHFTEQQRLLSPSNKNQGVFGICPGVT
ncbi:hypothetical protein DPX16_1448 [Anabarilius grahami]|uniref:Uncharacterized protein n=1 Tax=Anabarilius grahami TaxID=495550 RepID=A0A3N0YLP8_ANAGA|nr:hypothetical protein DPX16_1448 [Anabarilius grahami]